MDDHDLTDWSHDDEGWRWWTCRCGVAEGPFPDDETAVDGFGSHVASTLVARIVRAEGALTVDPDGVALLRARLTDAGDEITWLRALLAEVAACHTVAPVGEGEFHVDPPTKLVWVPADLWDRIREAVES